MKIGVCDWGIGGLGFYKLLRAERPDLDVVYIGDQGVPGYGLFDRKSLAARVGLVFLKFQELGVSEVVVACNAASTVVREANVFGIRAHGIIEPTLEATSRISPGKIGVIGGRRTIRSASYRKELLRQGWDVSQRVAQPLSRLIEDGQAKAPITRNTLTQILVPIKGVEYLVLACTHYIVLEDLVAELLPGVTLIDPATEAWKQIRPTLPPITNRVGETRFLTTGSGTAMRQQALTAFGVDALVEQITL